MENVYHHSKVGEGLLASLFKVAPAPASSRKDDPPLSAKPAATQKIETLTKPLALPSARTDEGISYVVSPLRLNDIRYINKYLESVNESLPLGGLLAGCVETSLHRQHALKQKFPRNLQKPVLFVDYLINRVWPKLPLLRKGYFALSKGQSRVISEMETYGRLYSCGFELVQSEEIADNVYFLAKKVKQPDFNMHATYGPLICLKRVGKNGKPIKVYKLRTMSPYSEYVQGLVYEWNGLGDSLKFKDDPRITPLGSFMRKYWIDELPMLYNLFRGDMKLFGVRPISQHYFSLYPSEFREYRKKFKPGLIPPLYVEIPQSMDDIVDIERRYLEAYEKNPLLTDTKYFFRAIYNILFNRIRSK